MRGAPAMAAFPRAGGEECDDPVGDVYRGAADVGGVMTSRRLGSVT